MRYRRLNLEEATYFFTVVTYSRQPLFADADAVSLLHAAIDRIRQRWPFILEAQVVLPDHIHALWTLPEGDANFATRWRLIKEAFTRAYAHDHRLPTRDAGRAMRGERTVWQRRYWEHLIKDDGDFSAHVEYIHFNPVRHGHVTAPRDWPHSTFGDWVAKGPVRP